MFTNTPAQDNHASPSGFSREFIEVSNVLNDVNNEARVAKGMEVYHIPD